MVLPQFCRYQPYQGLLNIIHPCPRPIGVTVAETIMMHNILHGGRFTYSIFLKPDNSIIQNAIFATPPRLLNLETVNQVIMDANIFSW